MMEPHYPCFWSVVSSAQSENDAIMQSLRTNCIFYLHGLAKGDNAIVTITIIHMHTLPPLPTMIPPVDKAVSRKLQPSPITAAHAHSTTVPFLPLTLSHSPQTPLHTSLSLLPSPANMASSTSLCSAAVPTASHSPGISLSRTGASKRPASWNRQKDARSGYKKVAVRSRAARTGSLRSFAVRSASWC